MSIFHLGFLCIYLSDEVISGYTTAAALIGLTSQVGKVLGISLPKRTGVGDVIMVDLFSKIKIIFSKKFY